MRMASIGVLVLAGALPCLLGAAPPPDGDGTGLNQIDLLPVTASTAVVDLGGRPSRIWLSLLQPVPSQAADAAPPTIVNLSLSAVDGKPLPGTLERPVVTLSYGRRNVRLVLSPVPSASPNASSYQSTATLPWTTGTKLQAKVEVKAGKARATARMDRVAISIVGPTL